MRKIIKLEIIEKLEMNLKEKIVEIIMKFKLLKIIINK